MRIYRLEHVMSGKSSTLGYFEHEGHAMRVAEEKHERLLEDASGWTGEELEDTETFDAGELYWASHQYFFGLGQLELPNGEPAMAAFYSPTCSYRVVAVDVQ